MEEVSPYSTDVVFLAQLVIITVDSPCSAVKCIISDATVRAVHTERAHLTHTHTRVNIRDVQPFHFTLSN